MYVHVVSNAEMDQFKIVVIISVHRCRLFIHVNVKALCLSQCNNSCTMNVRLGKRLQFLHAILYVGKLVQLNCRD